MERWDSGWLRFFGTLLAANAGLLVAAMAAAVAAWRVHTTAATGWVTAVAATEHAAILAVGAYAVVYRLRNPTDVPLEVWVTFGAIATVAVSLGGGWWVFRKLTAAGLLADIAARWAYGAAALAPVTLLVGVLASLGLLSAGDRSRAFLVTIPFLCIAGAIAPFAIALCLARG